MASPVVRGWSRSAVLRAGGVALCFVATLEVAARIDDWLTWDAPLVGAYAVEGLMHRDAGIVRGRPGARFEKWRMNALGFRGPETDLAARPGVTRIVVLGASETFGLFESAGAEFPAQLRHLLDSVTPGRFEVVNAALPGMSLSAMVPYLRRAISPLAPDLVILYPSPSFYLETEAPAPIAPVQDVSPPAIADEPARGGDRLGFRSRLVTKAKLAVKRFVPATLQLQLRLWQRARQRSGQPTSWVWTEVPRERMLALEAHLAAVVATADSIGARTMLVTHHNRFSGRPAPGSIEDRLALVGVIASYYPRASDAVMVGVDSSANRVLREVGAAFGLEIVETEGALKPSPSHFADYAHFTDAGARAMAEVLFRAVMRIPESP